MSDEPAPRFQLTAKEEEIHKWMTKFFEKNDRLPSTRELADMLGWSQSNAYRTFRMLYRKGWLERAPAGGYRWRRNPPPVQPVPIAKENVAGKGIPDDEVVFEVFPDDKPSETIPDPDSIEIRKVLE